MKKSFSLIILGVALLMFTGCVGSQKNISVSTLGKEKVTYEFQSGEVINTKKVLIDKSLSSIVTGAGIGAIAGGVSQKDIKGAAIGGVVGAVGGFVVGLVKDNNEIEAYETTIRDISGKQHKAFIKYKLPYGTRLEFVVRENGDITNINVPVNSKNSNLFYETVKDVISDRFYVNGYWHYKLLNFGIILKSKTKYYFLNDEVKVSFDKRKIIKDIKRTKRAVLKSNRHTNKYSYKNI